ncbi:hypothetical protein DD238_003466 [Peronospora effusa]|uniref:Kinesin-like protein n=1 Tax=Peronospora effusa TaxID=542832 RepID=A0A3M6VD86_9STRA|nr:hypothetical protein DD238_003466 [Peronospora effusa]
MADDIVRVSPQKLALQLRSSLSSLKHDVATSFRLCSRDFSLLGIELVSALERGRHRERASADALAHERSARGLLETRLAELQGNIRVLCRVRPMLTTCTGSSDDESDVSPDRHRRKRVQVESAQELSVFSPVDGALYKSFTFSRVFHDHHSQLTVFKEVAPLVHSAIAGHHACVFAYGQTGAGKTYTMQGSETDQGLYYRAAEVIYTAVAQQQHVYDFQVQIQMVEIYNEEIYDLLVQSSGSNSSTIMTSFTATGGSPSGCHVGATSMCGNVASTMSSSLTGEIRHGENGVYLKNIQSIAVSSAKELHDVVARSSASRTAAKNGRSNRSHTILMMDIRRTSKANGEIDAGRLVLVDLAGSERLSKTADTPALTVRESQHINKSLAAVGDVLSALLAKEKHIPFRNSKLTHLLQDSLSGSANRTLLLVHVSPTSADVNETINSLKFASRVSHVKLGKPQRTERAEITRLNGVVRIVYDSLLFEEVANQVSQIQALQEKLTAELELRKKYEKRLAEYRHEGHRRRSKGDEARRILQQLQTPSPPKLPPPVSARRWSLYTRKYGRLTCRFSARCLLYTWHIANDEGLNGIENVAENILRGNESSPETAEVRMTSNGKPSGISPPTNFSRRLSLSALDQKVGDPAKTQKRKRSSASEKVRSSAFSTDMCVLASILKKQRGTEDNVIALGVDGSSGDNTTMTPKQVSFDLSRAVIGSSSSSLPSRELNTASVPRVRFLAAYCHDLIHSVALQSCQWSGAGSCSNPDYIGSVANEGPINSRKTFQVKVDRMAVDSLHPRTTRARALLKHMRRIPK